MGLPCLSVATMPRSTRRVVVFSVKVPALGSRDALAAAFESTASASIPGRLSTALTRISSSDSAGAGLGGAGVGAADALRLAAGGAASEALPWTAVPAGDGGLAAASFGADAAASAGAESGEDDGGAACAIRVDSEPK